jgi:hypothetical protein
MTVTKEANLRLDSDAPKCGASGARSKHAQPTPILRRIQMNKFLSATIMTFILSVFSTAFAADPSGDHIRVGPSQAFEIRP